MQTQKVTDQRFSKIGYIHLQQFSFNKIESYNSLTYKMSSFSFHKNVHRTRDFSKVDRTQTGKISNYKYQILGSPGNNFLDDTAMF